jgi:hypothetical protein
MPCVRTLDTRALRVNHSLTRKRRSHRPIIEDQHGYSFDRPVRHLREYLEALEPLLKNKKTEFHGETLTAVGARRRVGPGHPEGDRRTLLAMPFGAPEDQLRTKAFLATL